MYHVFFPQGLKQPRHKVYCSPPTALSLKINAAMPPLPSYSFMVWKGTAITFLNVYTRFRNQTQFPQHCMLVTLWNRQSSNIMEQTVQKLGNAERYMSPSGLVRKKLTIPISI
jgi:hypothetical protein